jgi:hypothetical protein
LFVCFVFVFYVVFVVCLFGGWVRVKIRVQVLELSWWIKVNYQWNMQDKYSMKTMHSFHFTFKGMVANVLTLTWKKRSNPPIYCGGFSWGNGTPPPPITQ